MACRHNGYREIRSTYDADSGVLVYRWTCERCAEDLGEVDRTAYRPAFDPSGNDEYLPGRTGDGDPPALSA